MATAPQALNLVAEKGDKLCGMLSGYRLDWLRQGQISHVFICEILQATDPHALNQLVRAALDHADKHKMRGLVLENATHLSEELRDAGGLLRTNRTMSVAVRSQFKIEKNIDRFFCDIK